MPKRPNSPRDVQPEPEAPPLKPLTERQQALLRMLQGLDSNLRYTISLTCRGTEPWKVEKLVEHQDINLRPANGSRSE